MAPASDSGDLPGGDARQRHTGRGSVAPGNPGPEPVGSRRGRGRPGAPASVRESPGQSARDGETTARDVRSHPYNALARLEPCAGRADRGNTRRPTCGRVVCATGRTDPRGAGFGGGGVASRTTDRRTDPAGIADFGVVHPGEYTLSIPKNWEGGGAWASGPLTIEPGSVIRRKIVCPKLPLPRVPIRIRAEWPPDLATKGLVLSVRFVLQPVVQDQLAWILHENPGPPSERERMNGGLIRSFLAGPGASLTEVLNSQQLYLWGIDERPSGPTSARATFAIFPCLGERWTGSRGRTGFSICWCSGRDPPLLANVAGTLRSLPRVMTPGSCRTRGWGSGS